MLKRKRRSFAGVSVRALNQSKLRHRIRVATQPNFRKKLLNKPVASNQINLLQEFTPHNISLWLTAINADWNKTKHDHSPLMWFQGSLLQFVLIYNTNYGFFLFMKEPTEIL